MKKISQYDICTEHSEDVNRAVLQSDYNVYFYMGFKLIQRKCNSSVN